MKLLHFFAFCGVTLLVYAAFIFVPFQAQAQGTIGFHRFEITPTGGYQFGGRMYFYEGEFKIRNNANYGGAFSVQLPRGVSLELNYTRMDTKGDWAPYSGYQMNYPSQEIPLSINYFQFGVVKDFLHDRIRPFALFTMGATWYEMKASGIDDSWEFSVNLGGGVKIFITDYLGIRLQGRLLMPLYFNGAGFYYGIGSGGSGGDLTVGASTTFLQGDFQGGLIFAFGK